MQPKILSWLLITALILTGLPALAQTAKEAPAPLPGGKGVASSRKGKDAGA